MKYVLGSVSIFSFILFNSFTPKSSMSSMSTQQNTILIEDTVKAKPKGPMGFKAFLGCSTSIDGGLVDRATIIELLKSPLCVRDKNGETYTVKEFLLTYAERGVYQDSTGLPTIVTDYTTVQVNSNQLPQNVYSSLSERLYKGDTITFSDIYIDRNNSTLLVNKSLQVVVK